MSASKSYALEERRRVQDIILSAEAVKNVASACDYRSLLAGSDDDCVSTAARLLLRVATYTSCYLWLPMRL